jgi:glycosyltransferase involved in cell wall biosynthesis
MNKSISIIVPAYNEENNLAAAVRKYNKIAKEIFDDVEIIVFDDGSADRTPQIADSLAKKYRNVRVVHNRPNKGLGYNYRKGIELAKKEYFIMMSGEGETKEPSIRAILSRVGKADMIIPHLYQGNRPVSRRIISLGFTGFLNLLFGLRLKYYNGYVLHRTAVLKKLNIKTNSFAYQAETLIKLLKSGNKYTYIQLPYYPVVTEGSSMFRIKNLIGVGNTIARVFFEVYFKKKK